MLMPFTSDVVMLAVGFAIGYWILMSADRYQGRLNRIGELLAWVLIGATVFLTICNFFFAVLAMNTKLYIPVNGPNSPGVGQSVINTGESQGPSTNPIIQPGQPSEDTTGEGKPVTKQGRGPFGTP